AVKDLVILGKHAIVVANHYVYVQVGVDEFARGAGVGRCRQDDIAIGISKSTVFSISYVNCIPGTWPEVGEGVVFRDKEVRLPFVWLPVPARSSWRPDSDILIANRQLVTSPLAPLISVDEHFIDFSLE